MGKCRCAWCPASYSTAGELKMHQMRCPYAPDPRDAEIAALKARAEKAETEVDAIAWERGVVEDRLTQALAACAEMRAALEHWTHEYGAALKPPGADTYGEGKRDAKNEVAAILRGAK